MKAREEQKKINTQKGSHLSSFIAKKKKKNTGIDAKKSWMKPNKTVDQKFIDFDFHLSLKSSFTLKNSFFALHFLCLFILSK